MRTDETRIGVVVVAFNAASTLVSTLDRIPQEFRHRLSEIIVLDDASHDDTFELAKGWAQQQMDITSVVLRHEKNLGYGGNQKAAYALASERGLDVVVLLHGDGQYDPTYLPRLVQPIVDGECDAVFGSRMMLKGAARAGGMPLYKRLGNKVLTRFENKVLGTDLSEFHSGYRAYRVSALDRLPLEHNSDGFDFDTQIIVQLLDQGMRIVETPIPTYYGDEICYVNGMRYAGDVVRDVMEYRFAKLGFGTAPWVPTPAEYAFKEGDGSSHAMILAMLAGRAPLRILDLGCSGGLLAERLREHGHDVTGVDVMEIPGVRDRTDAFHLADLGAGLPAGLDGPYDVVVAADVMEHLPRPETVMRQVRDVLAPQGELLLSIPNFGHWYPRARVALGTFGYDRRGPLDDTHLRFYSRRTLRTMVRRAGFDVVEEARTGLPLGVVAPGDKASTRAVRRADRALVGLRPQLFAYQFVLRLQPHAAGVDVAVFEAPGTLTEILQESAKETGVPVVPAEPRALTPFS
jgi:glycosyltransferase involved in cell wall biosynthesis